MHQHSREGAYQLYGQGALQQSMPSLQQEGLLSRLSHQLPNQGMHHAPQQRQSQIAKPSNSQIVPQSEIIENPRSSELRHLLQQETTSNSTMSQPPYMEQNSTVNQSSEEVDSLIRQLLSDSQQDSTLPQKDSQQPRTCNSSRSRKNSEIKEQVELGQHSSLCSETNSTVESPRAGTSGETSAGNNSAATDVPKVCCNSIE